MATGNPRRTPASDQKSADQLAETNVMNGAEGLDDTNVSTPRPASSGKPTAATTPVVATVPGGSGSKATTGSKPGSAAKETPTDGDVEKTEKSLPGRRL